MKNPYQVLGVALGSSVEECKKAWRSLSQKNHPDNGGDEAVFDEVQKAWQAIKTGACAINVIERRSLRHVSLFSFV